VVGRFRRSDSVVRAGTGSDPRKPKIFSPRCSARSEAADRRPCRPAAVRQRKQSHRSARRPASAFWLFGGGQAYCVRTCDGRYFPIAASDRQRPGGLVQQFLSGQRHQNRLRQQHRQCRDRERKALLPNCRTRFATATSWSRDAPATARIRSVWPRSESKTIRRFARGHRRRQRRAGGRRPRRRQARRVVEFLAGVVGGAPRAISACRFSRRNSRPRRRCVPTLHRSRIYPTSINKDAQLG